MSLNNNEIVVPQEFTVPVGMCLTIASFDHQMSQSEELTQAMERLAAISRSQVENT